MSYIVDPHSRSINTTVVRYLYRNYDSAVFQTLRYIYGCIYSHHCSKSKGLGTIGTQALILHPSFSPWAPAIDRAQSCDLLTGGMLRFGPLLCP